MLEAIDQGLYTALEALIGALRFPPDMVPLVMLSVCALLVLALFARTWHTRFSLRIWLIAGTALTPVIAAFAFLLSLESVRGTPDDHCDQHEGGYMDYVLVDMQKVFKNPRDPNAGRWLILTVRAKRWGNTPHICRLDAAGAAGRQFSEALKQARSQARGDAILSDDGLDLMFSFRGGAGKENPGVTFKNFAPSEQKISPPDVPRRREDA